MKEKGRENALEASLTKVVFFLPRNAINLNWYFTLSLNALNWSVAIVTGIGYTFTSFVPLSLLSLLSSYNPSLPFNSLLLFHTLTLIHRHTHAQIDRDILERCLFTYVCWRLSYVKNKAPPISWHKLDELASKGYPVRLGCCWAEILLSYTINVCVYLWWVQLIAL